MKIYIEEQGEIRLQECDGPVLQIGRGNDNQLVIRDPRSSRHHCRVLSTPRGFFLEDLGSRNGTLLRGERVKRELLRAGDSFQIGALTFHFQSPPAGPEAEAAAAASSEGTAVETVDVYLEGLSGRFAGKRIPITRVPYTIGRKADNDFRIDDPRASGSHVRIVRRGETFHVEDLGSRNGTLINGRRIEKSPLVPGCRLKIGDLEFRVQVPGVAGVSLEDSVAADSAVGSDVVAEDSFSHFDVERFLRESESTRNQPLVLCGILLVMGAILYFTVDITLKRTKRTRPDPSPLTNRVAANWSFELPPDAAGAIPGWSLLDDDSGRLEIVTGAGVRWPGSRALELIPTDGGGKVRFVEAASETMAIDTGRALYLSGHVLNNGSFAAGVMVRWYGLADEELGWSSTAVMRQVGEEGDVVRKIFPPRSGTQARVSCFVVANDGGGGGAVFDRVYLGATPPPWMEDGIDGAPAGESSDANESDSPTHGAAVSKADLGVFTDPLVLATVPRMEAEKPPIRVVVQPDGAVAGIRRGVLPLVARIFPSMPPEKDPLAVGPALVEPVVYGRNAGIRLMTQVPDVVGESWMPVEIQIRDVGAAIHCRYRFQKGRDAESLPGEVAVCLELHGSEVRSAAFDERGERFELGAREALETPITELVLGHGEDQVVIRFSPAVGLRFLAANRDRSRPLIVATSASTGDKTLDLELVLSTSSRQEGVAMEKLMARARGLRELKQIVEALDVLAEIRRNYPWRDLSVVDELEKSIRKESVSVAQELAREFEVLRRVESPFVFRSIVARGEALKDRFGGADGASGGIGTEVGTILAAVQSFWEQRPGQVRRARVLFEAGQKLWKSGEIHLAELYLRAARAAAAQDTRDMRDMRDEEMHRRIGELLELIGIKRNGRAQSLNP